MQIRKAGILGSVGRFAGRILARVTTPQKTGDTYLVPFGSIVAGISLRSDEEVLKLSAAWRCVDLLSSSIAMLPWQVFKREGEGVGKRQADHNVEWLLHREASGDLTAFDFKKTIVAHSLLSGNGYAEIERDNRGQPYALHLLDPGRVTVGRNDAGGLVYAVNQNDGGTVYLPARDMFHVHGLAWDGVTGYSVLEVGARSIGAAMALDEFIEKFFAQGLRPAGFLKSKGKMSHEALKSAIDVIEARHSGVKKMFKPIPLDNELEWQQMASNLDDAQIIDMRKFAVVDICRWFGVPPHLVYELDRATFSNIESQDRTFLTYGLLPRIVPMEQEADRKLLTSSRGGLYTKMNVNSFQRGDSEKRGVYYKTMREMGVFTVNDILRLEDMDTIGPEGDVRVMQMQYQPTDGSGATPKTEPAPALEPDPAEPAKSNKRKSK